MTYMADWSYVVPPQRDIDLVRLIIGDTNQDRPKLQDGEISTFLWLEGASNPLTMQADRNVLYKASSRCARAIGNKYADRFDRATLEQKEAWSKVMDHYYAMADQLRKDVDAVLVPPRVGGQSIAAKFDQARNLDLPQPRFKRDFQFTEPGTGGEPADVGSDYAEVPW